MSVKLVSNLTYWMQQAGQTGYTEHPEKEMLKLGITYKRAIPQILGDQWWFIDCDNVPDVLPSFLTVLKHAI